MDWIKIGEINAPELSTIAWNVLRYAQRHKIGLHGREIKITRLALRIGENTMQEAIYEIRKRESIIMGKLTNAQKAAIYQAWKDGMPQAELAKQYGVTSAAICQLVKRLNKAGKSMGIKPVAETPQVDTAALPEQKPAVINQDFENAIDKMIEDAKAEKNSENAEKNAANAEVSEPVQDPTPELEDVENGIPNTPLVSEKAISPVIRRLVTYGISDMESEIEGREQRIAELKMEIEEFRKDIEIAKAWKEKQTWK